MTRPRKPRRPPRVFRVLTAPAARRAAAARFKAWAGTPAGRTWIARLLDLGIEEVTPRPGGRAEWRCACGAWNRAPCRVCGRGPDERYASGAELDALAGAADDLDRAASWLRLSGAPVSATTMELAAGEARRCAGPKRPRPPGGGRGKGRRRGGP